MKGKGKASEPARVVFVGGSFEEAMKRWRESPSYQAAGEGCRVDRRLDAMVKRGLTNLVR
jgi:hypothetical protein